MRLLRIVVAGILYAGTQHKEQNPPIQFIRALQEQCMPAAVTANAWAHAQRCINMHWEGVVLPDKVIRVLDAQWSSVGLESAGLVVCWQEG